MATWPHLLRATSSKRQAGFRWSPGRSAAAQTTNTDVACGNNRSIRCNQPVLTRLWSAGIRYVDGAGPTIASRLLAPLGTKEYAGNLSSSDRGISPWWVGVVGSGAAGCEVAADPANGETNGCPEQSARVDPLLGAVVRRVPAHGAGGLLAFRSGSRGGCPLRGGETECRVFSQHGPPVWRDCSSDRSGHYFPRAVDREACGVPATGRLRCRPPLDRQQCEGHEPPGLRPDPRVGHARGWRAGQCGAARTWYGPC